MIHILLMVLKIIGIILLVILGLLLLLLLAVLFVPIRYKAKGSWQEQPEGVLRVSWFLHLLCFQADYKKDSLVMRFKVMGYDLLKRRKKDAAEAAQDGAKDLLEKEGSKLYDGLMEDEARYRKAAEEKVSGILTWDMDEDGDRSCGTPDRAEPEEAGGRASEGGEALRDEAPGSSGRLPGLLKRAAAKIAGVWRKLKFSFIRFYGKLKGLQDFLQDKILWLEEEWNQASVKFLLRQIIRLIAHIRPLKGEGTVTFGFDDPYTTGQVLQAASLVYPLYHKRLSLYPVFDRRVLDAQGSFRGRIRLAFVLWLALQIFMDRHTRRMIRGFIK